NRWCWRWRCWRRRHCNRWRRRRRHCNSWRWGWCHCNRWRWRWATAAVVAMPYLSEELEGRSVNSAYTPDVSCSIEPCLVSLANRQWQIRWRGRPGPTGPTCQGYLVHLVGGVEETAPLEIATHRIQRVGPRVVGKAEV